MENQEENYPVYTIRKGESEEIKFSIRGYEKKYYADIRIWFRPQNAPQELWPTRKGILFRFSQMGELENGIRELKQAVLDFKPPALATKEASKTTENTSPNLREPVLFQPAATRKTQAGFGRPVFKQNPKN